MHIITFKEIQSLGIDPAQCCAWVDEALRVKGSSLLPKKISLSPEGMHNVFYNTMPSLIPAIQRGGVKLVTRYPKRTPALDSELLLYDMASGDCLALMDADWITTMRTGAVAAHSIKLLAKSGFTRVGFIGLGNTARATFLCLHSLFPERNLEVGLLRYKDQHKNFRDRFSDVANVSFTEFEHVEAMASWCDVLVSCVTAADHDFCSPDCFERGVLLVPVHTRGFAECDLVFDKVFADDRKHVSPFKYFERFEPKLTEVADVVRNVALGRESDEERILVYNIGISLHDIYFASKIYDMLMTRGIEITLEKPTEKIWV